MLKLDFVEKHGVIRILFWPEVVYNLNLYVISFTSTNQPLRPTSLKKSVCLYGICDDLYELLTSIELTSIWPTGLDPYLALPIETK